MTEERVVGIGSAEEQADFLRRHGLFMQRFSNLRKTFEAAFARKFSCAEPVDRLVFALGWLCVEDFMEILVLSGNGYGIGALKILRGMYEEAITALYLHSAPEEAENFMDYHWVSKHRLAQAIIDTFGETTIPKDKLDEARTRYDEVKNKFMVTACKKCDTKQLNYTWSRLNFVAMAKVAGTLGKFIVPAYYLPMQYTHPTVPSILSRIEEVEGGIMFSGDAQRKRADNALSLGHLVVLGVLVLQMEHFKLENLRPNLDECYSDYRDIWQSGSEDAPPASKSL